MANQDKLPHLPIPPLEDTMKRYLKALEGLQVSTLLYRAGARPRSCGGDDAQRTVDRLLARVHCVS